MDFTDTKDISVKSIRHFVAYHRILLSSLVCAALLIFADPTTLTILSGLPAIVAGVGIRIWSSGYLTKNQELVQSGPYALTRNPLYVGNFVIGIGLAIMAGKLSLMILFLISFAIIYFSTIVEEEKFLLERFGPEFSAYVLQAPRFIPWPTSTANGQARFKWKRVKGHREFKTWVAVGICIILMIFKSYYSP